MSYTPPDQYLAQPLEKAADALDSLQHPIRARLKDHHQWKDEHLKELAALLKEVAEFEGKLRLLASQVS